jgi:hypothetical protein
MAIAITAFKKYISCFLVPEKSTRMQSREGRSTIEKSGEETWIVSDPQETETNCTIYYIHSLVFFCIVDSAEYRKKKEEGSRVQKCDENGIRKK